MHHLNAQLSCCLTLRLADVIGPQTTLIGCNYVVWFRCADAIGIPLRAKDGDGSQEMSLTYSEDVGSLISGCVMRQLRRLELKVPRKFSPQDTMPSTLLWIQL